MPRPTSAVWASPTIEAIERLRLSPISVTEKFLLIKKEGDPVFRNHIPSTLKDSFLILNNAHADLNNLGAGFRISIEIQEDVASDSHVSSSGMLGVDGYEYEFRAKNKQRSFKKLTGTVVSELDSLLKEVPFDLGDNNIFSVDEGKKAVIIDTEDKGEHMQSILEKVNRYTK